MKKVEGVMMSLEYLLGNRRKSHIMGGFLLSTSLLFAGLAITVMTIKHSNEKGEKGEKDEQQSK